MITERTIEDLCDKIEELRDIIKKNDGGKLPDDFYKTIEWMVYDVRRDLRYNDFGDDFVSRAEYDMALAKIEKLEEAEYYDDDE